MDLHFFKGSLEAKSSIIKKFAMSMNSGVIIFETNFVEEVSHLFYSLMHYIFLLFVLLVLLPTWRVL